MANYPIKIILKTLSYLGLLFTAVPAFLSFHGLITFKQYEIFMIVGAFMWFLSAPFWVTKKDKI